MNKKLISMVIILTCLAFTPITSTADYPTGDLGFSDEIIPDAEFEWTVSKLTMTGDFASYTDYVYIGDIILAQGAKIKLVVLEDPDTAIGIWFDVFVDNVKVVDPYDFWIGYGSLYGFGGFFINPVTYTNATGTYNIYEQIIEELEIFDVEGGTSTDYGGLTVEISYSQRIGYKIIGDVFAMSIYMHTYQSVQGVGYDITQEVTIEAETTINTVTGLLGKSEVKVESDSEYMTGTMHIIIDSGYAATPYEWAFSFLGLTVIAAVVGLAKRKR
ncbi:MAG: hypothetical protein ACTSQF_11225 [Candidatus Heimdallarchaeaceae archaeon]